MTKVTCRILGSPAAKRWPQRHRHGRRIAHGVHLHQNAGSAQQCIGIVYNLDPIVDVEGGAGIPPEVSKGDDKPPQGLDGEFERGIVTGPLKSRYIRIIISSGVDLDTIELVFHSAIA